MRKIVSRDNASMIVYTPDDTDPNRLYLQEKNISLDIFLSLETDKLLQKYKELTGIDIIDHLFSTHTSALKRIYDYVTTHETTQKGN
jgi:hypothetical protein